MRKIVIAAGGLIAATGCQQGAQAPSADAWLLASSLEPPKVAYTPRPIITARETGVGSWGWRLEDDGRRTAKNRQTFDFEQLLSEVAAAKRLNPAPLILFSFAPRLNASDLTKLKSQIAGAAGCSREAPCIEGTPDQLP